MWNLGSDLSRSLAQTLIASWKVYFHHGNKDQGEVIQQQAGHMSGGNFYIVTLIDDHNQDCMAVPTKDKTSRAVLEALKNVKQIQVLNLTKNPGFNSIS